MKKREILSLLEKLASPAALMLVGILLIFNPDTASALISRVLGWGITIVGIGFGIWAIVNRDGAIGKGVMAVGLVCIGGFLSANPLLLAAFVGRILGVLIALRGIRDLFLSRDRGHGTVLAAIITIVGIVLMLLPMTASRLVFLICGVVLLVVGFLTLLDRLREPRLPRKKKDDIIDAL